MTVGRALLIILLVGASFGVLFLLAMVLGGQGTPTVVIGFLLCLTGIGFFTYKIQALRRKKA